MSAAGVLGAALLTARTGASPGPRPGAAPPRSTPVTTYLPCVVSDTGGLRDGAANQLTLEGVLDAAKDASGNGELFLTSVVQNIDPVVRGAVMAASGAPSSAATRTSGTSATGA